MSDNSNGYAHFQDVVRRLGLAVRFLVKSYGTWEKGRLDFTYRVQPWTLQKTILFSRCAKMNWQKIKRVYKQEKDGLPNQI